MIVQNMSSPVSLIMPMTGQSEPGGNPSSSSAPGEALRNYQSAKYGDLDDSGGEPSEPPEFTGASSGPRARGEPACDGGDGYEPVGRPGETALLNHSGTPIGSRTLPKRNHLSGDS